MSYVDAKKIGDHVFVSERDANGDRHIKKYVAPYFFYVPKSDGKYKSMFGDRLTRLDYTTQRNFRSAIASHIDSDIPTFESDVKVEYKLLEEKYKDKENPDLHICFTDIETESNKQLGFPSYDNCRGMITAITLYNNWEGYPLTFALAPPTLTIEEAEKEVEGIKGVYICDDEEQLLLLFLEAIDDADVITGWNTGFFDIPYIIQRIRIVLGGEPVEMVQMDYQFEPHSNSVPYLQRLCLFNQLPRLRLVEMYGTERPIFDLCGKVHIDYLDLYKSFTFSEQHSYKLDHILKVEIDQRKVHFEGTLDSLWKNQFRKFIEYSIQDVMGIVSLDDKLKFIILANQTAHMGCVFIKDALASVVKIEQAILLELHSQGLIGPDKVAKPRDHPVAGAFVQLPVGGMYEWIVSFDINSLYPSVIRLLNISPECIVGQFDTRRTEAKIKYLIDTKRVKTRTEAWHHFTGVLEYHDINEANAEEELTLVYEDGSKDTATGAEWHEMLKGINWSITANGTVFDMDKVGILPYCLGKWYAERQEYQALKGKYYEEGDLEQSAYWDRVQHVKKIYLNATYGALLNEYFRFNDPRFGQSVTLSGRVVTKHMIREANRIIAGEYGFGTASVYGDTDSAYMTMADIAKELDYDVDAIVERADEMGEEINRSFPKAMKEAFYVTEEQGAVIKAGREVVARRGIFKDKIKKRYALAVIDNEGKRKNKLKIMGMETQRSDTPEWIQDFLKKCLEMVVMDGCTLDELKAYIRSFREQFRATDPWKVGGSSKASNITENTPLLDTYYDLLMRSRTGRFAFTGANDITENDKPNVYWAVKAAYFFNKYLEIFEDDVTEPIMDGEKVEILYVGIDETNPLGAEKIAIPVGIPIVPQWLKNMKINTLVAEEKLIDNKLNNILDMMGWHFHREDDIVEDVFSFD